MYGKTQECLKRAPVRGGTNLGTSPSHASSSDFLLPEMMYTTFAMSCAIHNNSASRSHRNKMLACGKPSQASAPNHGDTQQYYSTVHSAAKLCPCYYNNSKQSKRHDNGDVSLCFCKKTTYLHHIPCTKLPGLAKEPEAGRRAGPARDARQESRRSRTPTIDGDYGRRTTAGTPCPASGDGCTPALSGRPSEARV